MATLSRDQLYQYAQAAGFTGAALDEVVAIALAESGGNTQAKHTNGASVTNGKQVPAGTLDRGVLQINDWWNPDVSDTCAYDPVCSFQWAFKVTGGKQPNSTSDPFKPYWVTVQNGAYKQHLTAGAGGAAGAAGAGVAGLLGPLIDLSPIVNWLNSLNALWDWLRNPVRLVKLLTGIGLVMASILLLLAPEVIEDTTGIKIPEEKEEEKEAQPKEGSEDE